ncbi:MAG: hypothetical protein PHU25_01745 [Deltaproteobacteria bacterium]|nr:hypothetical protein [Deltaproteobacteria bacterium]
MGKDEMTWSVFDRLTELAREKVWHITTERAELLGPWDVALQDLGGDPCRRDWSKFRPLRLSREEDWSDWLAHLLESSATDRFARALFGATFGEREDLSRPDVSREEKTTDGTRRGDIVITWKSGACAHVEVKVGDKAFAKTGETGEKLRENHPTATRWENFLLIPATSLREWLELVAGSDAENDEDEEAAGDDRNDDEDGESEPPEDMIADGRREEPAASDARISEVLWENVAVALRRALRAPGEDLAWRAWAYTFSGAIEQRILMHPVHRDDEMNRTALLLTRCSALQRQNDVLRKGLHDAD